MSNNSLARDSCRLETAEVDLSQGNEFTVGLSFGSLPHSAAVKLYQSFSIPFEQHRKIFASQWHSEKERDNQLDKHTGDSGHLLCLSQRILLAHKDKIFPGAFVASMSTPWNESKGDDDLGGYLQVNRRAEMGFFPVLSLIAAHFRKARKIRGGKIRLNLERKTT